MTNFGDYFRKLREEKGLTLRDVERETQVSNAYLSQLESEKIKQPSPTTLHKLAGFYGVSYALLMEKVGYPSANQKEYRGKNANHKTALSKFGKITGEEENELIEYLKFIRNRKQK
jgi:HTH-type transcriptional regulator, competence development regulator